MDDTVISLLGDGMTHRVHPINPHTLWWRIVHFVCFFTGGSTFIAGDCDWGDCDWGQLRFAASVRPGGSGDKLRNQRQRIDLKARYNRALC